MKEGSEEGVFGGGLLIGSLVDFGGEGPIGFPLVTES